MIVPDYGEWNKGDLHSCYLLKGNVKSAVKSVSQPVNQIPRMQDPMDSYILNVYIRTIVYWCSPMA